MWKQRKEVCKSNQPKCVTVRACAGVTHRGGGKSPTSYPGGPFSTSTPPLWITTTLVSRDRREERRVELVRPLGDAGPLMFDPCNGPAELGNSGKRSGVQFDPLKIVAQVRTHFRFDLE